MQGINTSTEPDTLARIPTRGGHNNPRRRTLALTTTKTILIEDDYEEMDEEPHTPIFNRATRGKPMVPPSVEERAKVLKLLSDLADMTRQNLGPAIIPTTAPVRRNVAEVPPI